MTEPVTRDEFERLLNKVDQMDATGTRGVAILAVQMQELSKDFARHEDKHDRADAARVSSRRWMVMAVIAMIAAIDAPIVSVLLALHGH